MLLQHVFDWAAENIEHDGVTEYLLLRRVIQGDMTSAIKTLNPGFPNSNGVEHGVHAGLVVERDGRQKPLAEALRT